jgi:V/A-type H+-transporting ATPase subunit I
MATARRALVIKRQCQELEDERDFLVRSIRTLEPWGDFRLPEDGQLGPLQFWFYALRHHQLAELQAGGLTWKVVSEDNQNVYVVVLSEDRPDNMPVAPVELDHRPLSQLRSRRRAVEEELDELYWERVSLTRWSELLARDLDEADDEVARLSALHQTLDGDQVFAVQGWVPRSATKDLRQFAKERQLALTIEEPKGDERPPTLLKNPERVAGAEGAVKFYITPDYHAWDPTLVVFFSFSCFFAMIMSDAGY